MNDDLISRKAAIDALAKFVPYAICDASTESYTNGLTDAYNLICQLPSAQPEQRWIPCSERLPDLNKYSHGKIWKQKVMITGYLSFDDKKELFISEAFASDVINGRVHDTVIIAWMPLPEPWKGDTRE